MKNKNIIMICIFALFFSVLSVMCYFKADEEISDSERRVLAQKPELSAERVFSGEYAKEFEVYAADQFPMRDNFRTVKAVFSTKILNKADNNGIYMKEGHISKLDYPENKEMMEYGAKKFTSIYHKFIKNSDADVYLSIVPDKNYFLAEKYGYPSINYENFIDYFESEMNYAVYIDIAQLLEIDDYYRTDSHWKQEKITGIAKYMAEQMGADEIRLEYTVNKLDNPFLGVYAGQSALPCEADEIKYLTNDIIDNAVVTYYDTGMPKEGAMYDMEKAKGKDPYEMFLSGSTPLVTIENPAATTERELVIFRDSFGSSIAPLLSQRYKKTTVVDIRYVQSDYLGAFIKFNNQDVLFLYSTTMLNNSKILR